MKRSLNIVTILLIHTSLFGQPSVPVTAKQVLNNTIKKLSEIKQIDYAYQREANYISDNYHNTISTQCYIDFTDNNPITGFKFSFKDDKSANIFNGTEYFSLNNKEKTIQITAKPQLKLFQHASFFYNSILTLKNTLPMIATDPDIKLSLADTLLNAVNYYKLTFSTANRSLAYIKGFDGIKLRVNKFYDVLIDKSTYLPMQVIERNNLNSDFTRTTFTKLNLAPTIPTEQSWFYSTYMPEYAIKSTVMAELIKPGTTAPQWKLPLYGKSIKDSVDLSNYKGKLTLIDVWIKNCGPCILSVPELNSLSKTYATRLNIVSVNVYDALTDVDFFIKKYKPEYTIAYNGQSLVKDYGIFGYPTVILLDENGRILYAAAGFDKAKIEQLIKEHS